MYNVEPSSFLSGEPSDVLPSAASGRQSLQCNATRTDTKYRFVSSRFRLVAITSLISSSLETCSLVSSNLSCGARLAALVFICWVALFQCKPESLVNGIPIHHWGLSHRFYRSVGRHVVNMRTWIYFTLVFCNVRCKINNKLFYDATSARYIINLVNNLFYRYEVVNYCQLSKLDREMYF